MTTLKYMERKTYKWNYKTHMYPSCVVSNMRRLRWICKPSNTRDEDTRSKHNDDLIFVDQMESRTPGIIPQIPGMHTNMR